jgi:hypothetical protein
MTGVTGEGPRRQRCALMTAKQRVSARRGRASRHLGYQRVGCDRISLPRASPKRKIALNQLGIRGMSGIYARRG